MSDNWLRGIFSFFKDINRGGPPFAIRKQIEEPLPTYHYILSSILVLCIIFLYVLWNGSSLRIPFYKKKKGDKCAPKIKDRLLKGLNKVKSKAKGSLNSSELQKIMKKKLSLMFVISFVVGILSILSYFIYKNFIVSLIKREGGGIATPDINTCQGDKILTLHFIYANWCPFSIKTKKAIDKVFNKEGKKTITRKIKGKKTIFTIDLKIHLDGTSESKESINILKNNISKFDENMIPSDFPSEFPLIYLEVPTCDSSTLQEGNPGFIEFDAKVDENGKVIEKFLNDIVKMYN